MNGKKSKYPVVVLIITLLLVLASIVLTFIGAFDPAGRAGLFKTGLFGMVFVPIFGWVMVRAYERVHRDDDAFSAENAPADSETDEDVQGYIDSEEDTWVEVDDTEVVEEAAEEPADDEGEIR